ncbi:MAG: ABC transporter ATP-binding protein [Coriobacteriia bacterium]|nr:ABC transporter ATP-binding protein [Coriobacteriia bacterium]
MTRALLLSLKFMRAYRLQAGAAVLAVLAASAADLVAPQILRWVIDSGIARGSSGVIWAGALALVAAAVAGGLATFVQGYLSARASHGAAYDMREAIFGKLQRLSFSYHDRAQTGQLITRVTSDVDLVREFVGGGLVQAVSAMLLLAGAVVLLLSMNARLAAVAFTVIPATVGVLLGFVGRLSPMFKGFQARLGALNSVLQENVAGVRVVRAFGREPHEIERFRRANEALLEQGMTVRRTVANAFPLLFSVGTIGVGVVTWAGGAQIVAGTLTVGELVAFNAYLFLLLQPLFVIGFGAQQIARAGASAERLFDVLEAEEEVVERPGAHALDRTEGRVEFRDVTLRYPGSDLDVLAGVSLTVAPGETLAVVGATGSGKTSLVNLVPRFYDVSEGAVLVDGHDVRDLTLGSLRREIGVVMQDSVLFSGTVRDNIAYGRPGASDAEVRAAARAAQADEFVMGLPRRYDTRVGERGVRLSGGQRQRIAIARALLVDPRILILDDSTSSVDAQTEAALRENLGELMEGRTALVVAQRLSTVRRADRIAVLEEGRLVDVGTHDELLERSCVYAEIAASQLGAPALPPPRCEAPEDAGAEDPRPSGGGR